MTVCSLVLLSAALSGNVLDPGWREKLPRPVFDENPQLKDMP